jgi:hypothetical protein
MVVFISRIGKSLLIKLHEAIREREVHKRLFKQLDNGWHLEGKGTEAWLAEIQMWESRQRKWDAGDDNPYRPRVKRAFLFHLRLRLN